MSDQPAPIDIADVCATINAMLGGKPFTLLCALEGPDKPGISVSNCTFEGMKKMIQNAYENGHSSHETISVQTGNG